MAVDTDTRKLSAVHVGLPWRNNFAIPSGALDEPEMFSVVHLYNEFAAAIGGSDSGGGVFLILHRRRRRS
jgi:hypothetical protein